MKCKDIVIIETNQALGHIFKKRPSIIAYREKSIIFAKENQLTIIMKTIKTKLFIVIWGMLIVTLTANCNDKKPVGSADTAEASATTESVIDVSAPPFKKFVVVTTPEEGLYKEADTNSPTLMRWIESDCESDFCENIYQWSDQPAKPGFEVSTDIMTSEGKVFPVLDEKGNFYKVCTLSQWCDIESAYIPKDCVEDIESAAIKADMLESEENYFKCRVVKDGKYKDVVFIDYDELEGETLQVGVLKDGVVATPTVYDIVCNLDTEQKEDITIEETKGHHFATDGTVDHTVDHFLLKYNKSVAMTADGNDSYQLDLKKLSAEQIAKIVDTVTKKKPDYVSCMYHFPAMGLEIFYYKAK